MSKKEELVNRLMELTEDQITEIAEYFLNEKWQAILDALRDCTPDQLERFFNHRFTVELLKLNGYDYAVVTAFVAKICEARGIAA